MDLGVVFGFAVVVVVVVVDVVCTFAVVLRLYNKSSISFKSMSSEDCLVLVLNVVDGDSVVVGCVVDGLGVVRGAGAVVVVLVVVVVVSLVVILVVGLTVLLVIGSDIVEISSDESRVHDKPSSASSSSSSKPGNGFGLFPNVLVSWNVAEPLFVVGFDVDVSSNISLVVSKSWPSAAESPNGENVLISLLLRIVVSDWMALLGADVAFVCPTRFFITSTPFLTSGFVVDVVVNDVMYSLPLPLPFIWVDDLGSLDSNSSDESSNASSNEGKLKSSGSVGSLSGVAVVVFAVVIFAVVDEGSLCDISFEDG